MGTLAEHSCGLRYENPTDPGSPSKSYGHSFAEISVPFRDKGSKVINHSLLVVWYLRQRKCKEERQRISSYAGG